LVLVGVDFLFLVVFRFAAAGFAHRIAYWHAVYAAHGAEFGVFGFESFVELIVFKVGKLKFVALHFGYAHVAVFLLVSIDVVEFASWAFYISYHMIFSR